MEDATTDIIYLRGTQLVFQQIEFNDPVSCIHTSYRSEGKGVRLVSGNDVNAVEGNLGSNHFFPEDGLVHFKYCLPVFSSTVTAPPEPPIIPVTK